MREKTDNSWFWKLVFTYLFTTVPCMIRNFDIKKIWFHKKSHIFRDCWENSNRKRQKLQKKWRYRQHITLKMTEKLNLFHELNCMISILKAISSGQIANQLSVIVNIYLYRWRHVKSERYFLPFSSQSLERTLILAWICLIFKSFKQLHALYA